MTPLAFSTNDKKSKNKATDSLLNFISIQGSYNHIELALFQNGHVLETVIKQDVKASSHLVPYLDTLLKNHKLTLQDLAFIAIDRGPGAFTSLRVSIATVNGIAFAHNIPLIGIDGLDALHHQTHKLFPTQTIVCLLNAYNNDVYYSINTEKGYKKIDLLLQSLESTIQSKQSVIFTGNGALLHQELIKQKFGENVFASPQISVCSAEIIGLMALENWQTQDKNIFPKNLIPNYVKTQEFAIKK